MLAVSKERSDAAYGMRSTYICAPKAAPLPGANDVGIVTVGSFALLSHHTASIGSHSVANRRFAPFLDLGRV